MTRKIIHFKEQNDSSFHDFIKRLSTDTALKKRLDKAIFLYFAMIAKDLDLGVLHRCLQQIFTDQEMATQWFLINNKYEFYKKTFDKEKLKQSWYIKLRYFEWVSNFLLDEDYVFFPDQQNTGQFVKEEEFKYLTYKLTEVLVKKQGYQTIARNFFLQQNNRVYPDYLKNTGRRMTKDKLAHMTRVLSQRDIIYCYRRPNKSNLFVIGTQNPYYQLKDILTDHDLSNIYTTYQIDVTDHFIRQAFNKNLIPGKREKTFRQEKIEQRKSLAQQKAQEREAERKAKERQVAFDQRGRKEGEANDGIQSVKNEEMEQLITEIMGDWKNS